MKRVKFLEPNTWFINPEQLLNDSSKRPTLESFERQIGAKGVLIDVFNFEDGTNGYRYRFNSVVAPCQMCGELTNFSSGTVVVDDDGKIFIFAFMCQNCQVKEYVEERSCTKEISSSDYADLKLDMVPEIPLENRSNRFTNFNSKIVSGSTLAINELKDLTAGYYSETSNRIVIITGKTGRGKTHLAVSAIRNYFLENSTKGASYINLAKFISIFREKTSNNANRSEKIALNATPFLVIDSVRADILPSFLIDDFNELIKYRIDNRLRTIIAGDLTTEEISKLFNQESKSRIKSSGKIISLIGEDYRQLLRS